MNWVGFSSSLGSVRKLGLAALIAVSALQGQPAVARGTAGEATVSLAQLPAEAQRTEQLVRAGGPFPYAKDGVVFGNRERLLPRRERGYYREYTVPTPGARNRGARRLVCGGSPPTNPETCYYTDDHYASFRRIAP
ncbi:guanyl-specific ribonuclease Sa [Burkholderiales bacterium JOSHI_001]|nr:guanyl-specific ribonuclease Sa [Burkholderiales bacterium JOSHI_001]